MGEAAAVQRGDEFTAAERAGDLGVWPASLGLQGAQFRDGADTDGGRGGEVPDDLVRIAFGVEMAPGVAELGPGSHSGVMTEALHDLQRRVRADERGGGHDLLGLVVRQPLRAR